jgi:hypothetical protein
MLMYGDNREALAYAKNLIFHSKLKYIVITEYYVRKIINEGKLNP